MDETGSRPTRPLARTHQIERRENPSGEICEIVPGHTVGDKVPRRPICWGMTAWSLTMYNYEFRAGMSVRLCVVAPFGTKP